MWSNFHINSSISCGIEFFTWIHKRIQSNHNKYSIVCCEDGSCNIKHHQHNHHQFHRTHKIVVQKVAYHDVGKFYYNHMWKVVMLILKRLLLDYDFLLLFWYEFKKCFLSWFHLFFLVVSLCWELLEVIDEMFTPFSFIALPHLL